MFQVVGCLETVRYCRFSGFRSVDNLVKFRSLCISSDLVRLVLLVIMSVLECDLVRYVLLTVLECDTRYYPVQ